MLEKIVLFAVLAVAVEAANVGDRCTANSQCSPRYSYCHIASATCGKGVCSCIPGFGVGTSGSCQRAVQLGGQCGPDDMCVADNAECSDGTCSCSQGYKTGLRGTDCVSTLKTERYNGKCYDSVQCYYNMVCLNNQCTCYTGFKVVGDYECVERTVSDACASDDDCSRTANTGCLNGQCMCLAGYKKVSYMTSATKRSNACVSSTDSQQKEGASCNYTVGASGSTLCSEPYVCTACDSSTMQCGRIQPLYSNSPSTAPVLATLMLLAVAAFFH